MQTETQHITVLMPNDSLLHVTYYLSDEKLKSEEQKTRTQLFIQLHDCISVSVIDKEFCKQTHQLETLVHNKVINAKGHLC